MGSGVLVPAGWSSIGGLIAGFGAKDSRPNLDGLVRVRQVHGTRVVVADGLATGRVHEIDADALVVTALGITAAVATADCVPILLVEPDSLWGAVVHAGWRGTVAGIIDEAVHAASVAGIAPNRLMAALGPAIGACCYEVGDDVAMAFARARLPVLRDTTQPRVRLDLRECNRHRLTRVGLLPERIQVCGPCTRCRPDRYHSHRATPGTSGRQLSWLGWEGRSP